RDSSHPYGHGKVEFLSAGFEGAMIIIAGIFIIYEAVKRLIHPQAVSHFDVGMMIILITGVGNFIAGYVAQKNGNAKGSLTLVSAGKHLQSDAYTSLAILLSL